jgi:predicted HicB family RNase H-like nuclease
MERGISPINEYSIIDLSSFDHNPQRRESSGKFNVRVPRSRHAALASEADAEGVSLSEIVVAKLALRVQAR